MTDQEIKNIWKAYLEVCENKQLDEEIPNEKLNESYEYDPFDDILEHLVAEGYADTNENALAIMANMSEEWRQDIMEISRKTATSAYAKSATGEFEGAARGAVKGAMGTTK